MGRIAACILFALLLPGAAQAGKKHCTLRVHETANPQDGDTFSTRMKSAATGKDVVIEKTPTISEQDVVAFAAYKAADGSYGVLFQLNDHGKLALDTLSVERRGRFLYVFINGRPIDELQVDRRVSDGKLFIASGLTPADLALMKKDWPVIGQRKK